MPLATSTPTLFSRLALFAAVFAFAVMILGAFTRLSDSGLGCPDWPGCYGQITVPKTQEQLARAQSAYPGTVVETTKAWAEMSHRYIAGSLSLFVFGLAVMAIKKRHQVGQPVHLPLGLVALVIFQAILGMWTVTMLLLPLVVMGHLMGGMAILGCLWWLGLRAFKTKTEVRPRMKSFMPWAILGLVIVYIQIALGGWTGANYSALACPDFPYCQGKLVPKMDFSAAFNFFHPIGVSYEGGVLHNTARITINTVHRYFALVTGIYLLLFSICCIAQRASMTIHTMGLALAAVLVIQMTLGVLNITHLLPLVVAVLHNAFGALLLLTMLTIIFRLKTIAWDPTT